VRDAEARPHGQPTPLELRERGVEVGDAMDQHRRLPVEVVG
jgi:hypothetical protein